MNQKSPTTGSEPVYLDDAPVVIAAGMKKVITRHLEAMDQEDDLSLRDRTRLKRGIVQFIAQVKTNFREAYIREMGEKRTVDKSMDILAIDPDNFLQISRFFGNYWEKNAAKQNAYSMDHDHFLGFFNDGLERLEAETDRREQSVPAYMLYNNVHTPLRITRLLIGELLYLKAELVEALAHNRQSQAKRYATQRRRLQAHIEEAQEGGSVEE